MSLINFSIKHGRTLPEAQASLEGAIREVLARYGAMVQKVEWSADRTTARLTGVGFDARVWVDAVETHASLDIPLLGQFLAGPLTQGLKGILENAFPKRLTGPATLGDRNPRP